MKAKKVSTLYGKYYNTVTYEYRGKTYEVEYANGFTGFTTPAHVQHEDAQTRIDQMLDSAPSEEEPFDIDEVFSLLEMEV